ncbi:MAG: hypothetical protein NTW19_13495 [Planctomycetota bacterium]|nr:hypothetical protein [Planctomycetota bacterium]
MTLSLAALGGLYTLLAILAGAAIRFDDSSGNASLTWLLLAWLLSLAAACVFPPRLDALRPGLLAAGVHAMLLLAWLFHAGSAVGHAATGGLRFVG